MRPIPDVALIGAMKAGTTTLARQLDRHPQLAVARAHQSGMYNKEPGYFSHDERFALGDAWYRAHFAHAEPGQLTVDASTCYSRVHAYPHAIERLHAANPQAKLIYILRHPVERVYSNYLQYVRRAFSRRKRIMPLLEYLATAQQCMGASDYASAIEDIDRYFDGESLLCLRFEELKENSSSLSQKLADHMNVSIEGFNQSVDAANQHSAQIQNLAEQHVWKELKETRFARLLRACVPQSLRAQGRVAAIQMIRFTRANQRIQHDIQQHIAPLNDELAQELHARLDPATIRLGELLGWDVSDWLYDARAEDRSAERATAVC